MPNLPIACLSIALVIVSGLSSSTVMAAENLQVKNDIINLMLCYGTGTDTFGDASNPDSFNDGLDIYEACFTYDAVFRFWPPGTDFNDTAPIIVNGPEAWAHFVADGLNGDSLGQHMLSNFIVDVNGNTGTLKAYFTLRSSKIVGWLHNST
ncbi:nuclear transport factor 2 family protein [Pseudomonadota bacterium]